MKQKLDAVLESLEKVPNNMYALAIIATGAVLCLTKHEEAGKAAMSSGFTLLSHKQ